MEKKIYHLDIAKLPSHLTIDEYIDLAGLTVKIMEIIQIYSVHFNSHSDENYQYLYTDILNLIVSHGKEKERPVNESESNTEDSQKES